ncbi:hypothetical protein INR49_025356, partial [Caranx melampygus]
MAGVKAHGLRWVVGSHSLWPNRPCGGVFLAHYCFLHCGDDTPARIVRSTPDVRLEHRACHWNDWKCCTTQRWPATMST